MTVAIQALEGQGLIGRRRGYIIIKDRTGLMKLSNGTYHAAEHRSVQARGRPLRDGNERVPVTVGIYSAPTLHRTVRHTRPELLGGFTEATSRSLVGHFNGLFAFGSLFRIRGRGWLERGIENLLGDLNGF